MNEEQLPRWPCWAAFAGAALLFLLFWQWMAMGSIFIQCDPDAGDAAFIACDRAVGRLQGVLSWAGWPALAVAALGEWRWRWAGPPLLLVAGGLLWLLSWAILK